MNYNTHRCYTTSNSTGGGLYTCFFHTWEPTFTVLHRLWHAAVYLGASNTENSSCTVWIAIRSVGTVAGVLIGHSTTYNYSDLLHFNGHQELDSCPCVYANANVYWTEGFPVTAELRLRACMSCGMDFCFQFVTLHQPTGIPSPDLYAITAAVMQLV